MDNQGSKHIFSDPFYLKLLNNISDVIVISNADGIVTYKSPNIEKYFGWEPQECLGRNLMENVHSEDLNSIQKSYASILERANTVITAECRYKCKDGSYKWIDITATNLIHDKDINGILINYHDITESKWAEQEIRRNDEKYRNIVEGLSEAIYCMKLPEGTYEYFSSTVSEVFGYTLKDFQLIPLFIKRIIHPDFVEFFKKAYEGLLKGEVPLTFEYKIIDPNGKERWIFQSNRGVYDGTGKIIAIEGLCRNITEQKNAEEALLENQKLLSESQRIAKIGSWILDLKSLDVIWSDEAYDIFGYQSNEKAINLDVFYSHIHYDDVGNMQDVVSRSLQSNQLEDFVCRIITENQKIRYVSIVGEAILDENNEVVKMLGAVQDITDKKEAEIAFREKDAMFKTLFHNLTSAASIYKVISDDQGNAIDYRFITVNSTYLETTGGKENEIVGKTILEVFPKTEKVWLESFKKVYLTGIPIQIEEYAQEVNMYFELVVYRPHTDLVALIGTDVTQRRLAEIELIKAKESAEESEQRFKALHNASFGGIAIHEKGLILDCNKSLSDISGYSYEELIGMDGLLLIAEETRKYVMDKISSGYEKPYEALGVRKNGKVYPVRLEARNIPFKGRQVRAVEFRDVIDIKKAEADLIKAKEAAEENEFILRESQRAGNIGSYKMSFETGFWMSTETLNSVFGIDDSYVKDTAGWIDIVHPDDQEMMVDYFQNEVIGKHKMFNREYRIKRIADKEIRWIHGIGKLYFNSAGELTHMLGTIQDITERKLIDEERKMMNLELEKRVKERTIQLHQANSDLESFAYSVSHDLRAPIRHIDGFMHLLESAIQPMDVKAQNYLDKISLSTKNMSTMIDELLRFSRLGRADLKTVTVNLSEIVNQIIKQSKPDYLDRKIKWKIGKIPEIEGDPELLKIAFQNLISNAIKYTSKVERAVIEIGQKENDQTKRICIFIKDNGAGFDMAYKDKLFGVFQRLHKSKEFEGIGIGLANVKQIVTRHKGTIDAESETNSGATFYITLPTHK